MGRGPSWALDDITVVADAVAHGESVYQVAKEHGWPPARHPSNFSHHVFEILLTFGKVKASVTSRKVKNGSRQEHVNIDTTTCDPIVSMSKEKIGLKMRVLHKNKNHRGKGPFDSKGPNPA